MSWFQRGFDTPAAIVLGALVSHTVFDVVDFLLCEIEDTMMDGCRDCHQLPYAHYLSYIFERLIHHP